MGIGGLAVGDPGAVVLDHSHAVDAGRGHLVLFEFAVVRLEREGRFLLDNEVAERARRDDLVEDPLGIGFHGGNHQALPPTRMSSTFSVA